MSTCTIHPSDSDSDTLTFVKVIHDRSENQSYEKKKGLYLSDIRELQDVREDVEAWGLQQRADGLGQC